MRTKGIVQDTFSLTRPKARRWVEMYDHPADLFELTMQMRRDRVIDYLTEHCAQTSRVLDVGCGSGPLASELAAYGMHVVAMDLSWDLLTEAAARITTRANQAARVLQGDCEQLPFRESGFDVVTCLGVISFVDDHEKALREMHRMLKRGGTLVVSVRSTRSISVVFDPARWLRGVRDILAFRKTKTPHRRRAQRFDLRDLAGRLRGMGFTVEGLTHLGYGPLMVNNREILPSRVSIAVSRWLSRMFEWKPLRPLQGCADVCILVLRKV